MTDKHPIIPPKELVWEWASLANEEDGDEVWISITTQAAQWGANQELEACCEEMKSLPKPFGIPFGKIAANALYAARRPKPPSLKEQALEALEVEDDAMPLRSLERSERFDTIRRALEALPND